MTISRKHQICLEEPPITTVYPAVFAAPFCTERMN